jgi:DNA-binding transcriptional ArsR family regulator
MDIEKLALLHKAISVSGRLKILKLISDRPLCVNVITRSMDVSHPSVSQLLAVLKHAGLVTFGRSGVTMFITASTGRDSKNTDVP